MKTTLFMLMSLDGKISTGKTDKRDVDKDFPKIKGVREGLKQYYDLERKTDLFSMNSGRVMFKIGINQKPVIDSKSVSFVIIDRNHLSKKGVSNLSKGVKKLYLVTSNRKHPAFGVDGVEVIYYSRKIDFVDLFRRLEKEYGIKKLTVQTGGTLNAILIREGLIDRISLVVAPCIVGGKETSTLVDGESIASETDLKLIKSLKLVDVKKLKNSYLNLIYEVRDD